MPGIGLPPRGAVSSEDVCNLQRRAGQVHAASLQASPQRLVLKIGRHLVWAGSVLDRLRGNVGVLRRRRQLGMPQQDLNDAHVRVGFQQMRREAVPQGLQRNP